MIATPGSTPVSVAAKAATATIPIVFGVAEDPVKLGFVPASHGRAAMRRASTCSPTRAVPKRLGLLHDLVPRAVRLA